MIAGAPGDRRSRHPCCRPGRSSEPRRARSAAAASSRRSRVRPKIAEVTLVPDLRTIPVPHDRNVFNVQMVNAALLPRDKEGIWVLDFAFKPLRIKTVEIPGKGRKQVHYLYYKVMNRTGKPRMFVPEFIMVNEQGQKFEDNVDPAGGPAHPGSRGCDDSAPGGRQHHGHDPAQHQAGRRRRRLRRRHLGEMGPQGRPVQHLRARAFRRLQGGSRPAGGKPTVKYKTLRIDFIRRGDERNLNEKEIYLNDPPYEWVYW